MVVTFQWSWNEWERVTSVSTATFYSLALGLTSYLDLDSF